MVITDPAYRQFKKFNRELRERLGIVYQAERNENKNDMFKYTPLTRRDRFFMDDDDGPSWNIPPPKLDPDQVSVNPYDTRRPNFYFTGGGGFN